MTPTKDDLATLMALGVLAMCLVTVDHEVIGHGGACLASGGIIVHVSTTLFVCSVPSYWIAAAGPAFGTLVGALALLGSRSFSDKRPALRLFLVTLGAISLFWEAGYLVKAMLLKDGDLYFFLSGSLHSPDGPWRWVSAGLGVVLYLGLAIVAGLTFSAIFGAPDRAFRASQIVWVAATAGAMLAALPFKGELWPTLRDAGLEVGVASLPLLLLRPRGTVTQSPTIARKPSIIGLAAIILTLFAVTQGHGIGTF